MPQSSAQPYPDAPDAQALRPKPRPSPQAKSQAEFDAYKATASLTDPAKLAEAATDFAQRFPASELRSILFQQAMGLYQQANDPGKTLEMARAALKYDPGNAVALLSAAQILAERTHDDDLDRNDRLAEAAANASSALQSAGNIPPPSNMTPQQFASALAEIRGAAHAVFATVAFKEQDIFHRYQGVRNRRRRVEGTRRRRSLAAPRSGLRQNWRLHQGRRHRAKSHRRLPARHSGSPTGRAGKISAWRNSPPPQPGPENNRELPHNFKMKHLPLDDLEKSLGHQFANRALLEQALTHSSFASESPAAAADNEQLEFLGDAVLQLVASQELFQRFPAYQEGELPNCAPISSMPITF